MTRKLGCILFILLAASILVGCGTPTPRPSLPTVPAATTSPIVTPTSTRTHTPTITPTPTDTPTPTTTPPPTATPRPISILADDFGSYSYQRAQGDTINRLDGQHRPVFSTMDWASGLVTATLGAEMPWGGGQMSLNHPLAEGLPINFAAILPRADSASLPEPDHRRHRTGCGRYTWQHLPSGAEEPRPMALGGRNDSRRAASRSSASRCPDWATSTSCSGSWTAQRATPSSSTASHSRPRPDHRHRHRRLRLELRPCS